MNEISSFYDETDLRYPEIAICLERTYGPTGKFSIPILTPFMDNYNISREVIYNSNAKTLVSNNKKELGIGGCEVTNYLELKLPDIVLHEMKYHDPYMYIDKGEKFIAVFVGGDINKCKLISRYNDV